MNENNLNLLYLAQMGFYAQLCIIMYRDERKCAPEPMGPDTDAKCGTEAFCLMEIQLRGTDLGNVAVCWSGNGTKLGYYPWWRHHPSCIWHFP